MSNPLTRESLRQLPFMNMSDFDIENNYLSAKAKVRQLMENHGLPQFIEENYFTNLFNPENISLCQYYDEDAFDGLRRDSSRHLNVFSMNIRSLPKHGGELVVYLDILKTKFDVIVLTEIGARNLTVVEHLFTNFTFYYTIPTNNQYGGVGIYLSHNISQIQVREDIQLKKTCNCHKCEMESLFIDFQCMFIDFL